MRARARALFTSRKKQAAATDREVGKKKREKDAEGEGESGEKGKREARRVDTGRYDDPCVCFVSFYRFFKPDRGRRRFAEVSVDTILHSSFFFVGNLFVFSLARATILPRGTNRAEEVARICKQSRKFDRARESCTSYSEASDSI